MFDWLFGKKRKVHLGIDFGVSSIKLVELAKENSRFVLQNYALARAKEASFDFEEAKLKEEKLAEILKNLLSQADFKSREASVSLPVGKTFSTVMDLPLMPEKELAAAVDFEAQKYVPVPLNEVILDWSIISETGGEAFQEPEHTKIRGSQNQPGIQVLLVAVPKEVVDYLTHAAAAAGVKISAFEHEAFSLARALVGSDPSIYLVVDLGPKSADIVLIEKGLVKASYCLEAETKETVLMEIDRIVNLFQIRYNKRVNQCLLAGGRVLQKDFFDFLAAKLRMPVKIGEPFARLQYPEVLQKALKELGPQLAVAVGLAMRED